MMMMMRRMMATCAYLAVIVAANWATSRWGLVSVGPWLVPAGTFAAGAALILRDWVDQTGGRRWVLGGIMAGCALSAIAATPAIAVASAVAFAVSELVDWAVYARLRARSLPAAVLASSAVSAPVDTTLFLAIAGFAVTWPAMAGQFAVKTGMAACAAAWIWWRQR